MTDSDESGREFERNEGCIQLPIKDWTTFMRTRKEKCAREGSTSVPSPPLRVLVVEDSLDVAEPLALQLKQWGYDCRLCVSGGEALALAPFYDPNVVLIDIGLPDMDGWELAQRLPNNSLLIAITARGEGSDFRRSQQAGIRYHLVKPAFQRQLRELLERVAPSTS